MIDVPQLALEPLDVLVEAAPDGGQRRAEPVALGGEPLDERPARV